jgi:hypothetical protein
MIFTVLKKSSKCFVLLSGILCVSSLSLSSIPPAVAANPADVRSAPIEIRDCIPQEDAGIIDFARVPADTSFAVLIRSVHGIKLNGDPDDRATFFWAVYDRSLEPVMPIHYPPDSHINIKVAIRDVAGYILRPAAFEFRIESAAQHAASEQNLPETEDFYPADTDSGGSVYAGIQVVEGELAGAKIVYNSNEPLTPQFGSQDGIEKADIDGFEVAGMPLNLVPHTVFNTPVTLFIPVPAEVDIFSVGLAYHDGTQWLPAADAAGNVLPGGEGWMVPGSRVNHTDTDPALIEVQVYHFSSTQTVFFAAFL